MYCKIYINYRGARQIAWLMFQTLLRRSALAAVFSSAVWVRDKIRAQAHARVPALPDLKHTAVLNSKKTYYTRFL